MPRKNRAPKHIPFIPQPANEQGKRRFASKQAAERAIKELQKYQLDLELHVYQSPTDGGWYLTSK